VAYKAPELFRGEQPTEKCDVYSLAITMWQLITREQPYMAQNEHSVIYKVRNFIEISKILISEQYNKLFVFFEISFHR
jgi:hypothetical protein